jgi:hypothetical protein
MHISARLTQLLGLLTKTREVSAFRNLCPVLKFSVRDPSVNLSGTLLTCRTATKDLQVGGYHIPKVSNSMDCGPSCTGLNTVSALRSPNGSRQWQSLQ